MKLTKTIVIMMATLVLSPNHNVTKISAAPPYYMNYQGRLKYQNKPVSDYRFFEFKITNSDGSQVYWTSGSTRVWVNNGLFRYVLGPFDSVNWANIEPYLEVKVGIDSPTSTLLPREKLVSSLYAIFSASSSYSYETLNANFLNGRPYEAFVSTRSTDNQMIGGYKTFTSTVVFNQGVGIGTLNPQQKLHVAGYITTDRISIGPDATAWTALYVRRDADGTYPAIVENLSATSNAHGLRITAGDNGAGNTAEFIRFFRPDGTLCGIIQKAGSASVQYLTTSDKRRKNNITDTKLGLADLTRIIVRDFKWKDDPSDKIHNGLIAQELYEIYPDAVSKPPDETRGEWSVDYGRLTPLLIKSIQELYGEVVELKKELETLKASKKR